MINVYDDSLGIGYWLGWIIGLIILAVIIVLVVRIIIQSHKFKQSDTKSALDVSAKKYVRGKIDKAELEEKKKDLKLG
jgi:uncharacterized membrane protein